MSTQKMLAAVALGLLLGIPGQASAQYRFTTIDVPDSTLTNANGNSPHEVVGSFDDADGHTHGFVLTRDGFTQVDVPGAWCTTVNGINAAGEVAGAYEDDAGSHRRRHGVILRKGGVAASDAP